MNKEYESNQKEFVLLASRYLNTFNTVEEFLNETHRMNILGAVEKAAIEEFLKEKKIPLAAKIVKSKVKGLRLEWKTQSLTIVDLDVVKTTSGRIIKMKNKAMDVVFKEIFNAETSKKTALNLLLPEAHAETIFINRAIDEKISSAFTGMWLNARKELGSIGDAFSATLAKARYKTLLKLREKRTEVIECYGKDYVYKSAFEDEKKEEEKVRKKVKAINAENVRKATYRPLTENEIDIQVYQQLIEKLSGTYVNDNILRTVWPMGDIPKCDKTTLASAQKAILEEVNTQEISFQRLMKDPKTLEKARTEAQSGNRP